MPAQLVLDRSKTKLHASTPRTAQSITIGRDVKTATKLDLDDTFIKDTIEMEMDQRGLAIARNRIDKNQPKSLKKNKSDPGASKGEKVEILKAMLMERTLVACGINLILTV
jgi:hypothetical protein